jgi:hypothetical protein
MMKSHMGMTLAAVALLGLAAASCEQGQGSDLTPSGFDAGVPGRGGASGGGGKLATGGGIGGKPDAGATASAGGKPGSAGAGGNNGGAGAPATATEPTTPSAPTTPATPTPPTTPPVVAVPTPTPPATAPVPAAPTMPSPTPPVVAAPATPPAAPATPPVAPPAPVTPPAPASPPPAAPPPAATIRIAAVGDFGEDNTEEKQVSDLVKSWKPDHVITLGDNNYQAGEAVTIDRNIGKYYAEFIGNYVGMFGPGSATNRFWPSPGNHDWVQPDLKPYTQYFTLPNNERYYDVDLGLVHLWAMDSDEHEPDGNQATSTQGKWLQARLPASKACYDLVFFHYPPHSTGDHGDNPVMDWPFEAWGAEAVMSGHDHDYERFQFGNLPYFVNGMGGAGNYTFSRAQPPESKFRVGSGHGAMLITATSSSITYEFWTFDGKKIDTLTVPKKCS